MVEAEVVVDISELAYREKSPNNTDLDCSNKATGHTAAEALACLQVIQDETKLTVRLSNQKEYKAAVVGSDPANDVAVLRVDVKPGEIQRLRLGTSHNLLEGQDVLSIGHPFGPEQTLSSGKVINEGELLWSSTAKLELEGIQTDCLLFPGSSGGPLLDSEGHLVGMNMMCGPPSGECKSIWSPVKFFIIYLFIFLWDTLILQIYFRQYK